MSFGKHNGKQLGEIPIDYLEWFVRNIKSKRHKDTVRKIKKFLGGSQKA